MSETIKELRNVVREPKARAACGGLGKSQFWDLIKDGVLPAPFKPHDNSRVNLWFEDELIKYQQARAEKRNLKGPGGPAAQPKETATSPKPKTRVPPEPVTRSKTTVRAERNV
jgi:hypothetical protein